MITKLEPGTLLYHGSYCEVRTPELKKCRQNKDFGKGFYLTTDIAQAKSFARLTLEKMKRSGAIPSYSHSKAVSCFEYISKTPLEIKYFDTADKDWLHCIVGHRVDGSFPKIVEDMAHFDIIGGKIANDATNSTIFSYILGAYGEQGTERADDICISLLLPERLKDQFCFRTQRALDTLVFRKVIML